MRSDVERQIREMVERETRAWNERDADALVELFHPDMVWPWPPVRNRRTIVRIEISEEEDGAFAVVDVETLWRDRSGRDFHWQGRACKGYTLVGGVWKLIFHTGLLAY